MLDSPQSSKSPSLLLTVLVFISLGFYLIVPNIYLIIAAAITGSDMNEIINAIHREEAQPFFQNLFLIVQGLAAGTSIMNKVARKKYSSLRGNRMKISGSL